MRDEMASGNVRVPAAAPRVLGYPSLRGGFNLGQGYFAFLCEFQIVDDLDLEGGDPAQRGWLGALLGAVGEVGEARLSQWSGKVALDRVGPLEELVEFEHGRISLLKEKRSDHRRPTTLPLCAVKTRPGLDFRKEMPAPFRKCA